MIRTILLICLSAAPSLAQFVAALDGYHKNKANARTTTNGTARGTGGFSEFGNLLKGLGGELRTIREPIESENVAGVQLLIIVDPDTPAETEDPNTSSRKRSRLSWNGSGRAAGWRCSATTRECRVCASEPARGKVRNRISGDDLSQSAGERHLHRDRVEPDL